VRRGEDGSFIVAIAIVCSQLPLRALLFLLRGVLLDPFPQPLLGNGRDVHVLLGWHGGERVDSIGCCDSRGVCEALRSKEFVMELVEGARLEHGA
jgi:hypothetical protein